MFGISFNKIILIFIIALLVLGPKQLHAIILKLRQFIISFRSFSTSIKNELYQQSGFNQIQTTKNILLNDYLDIKHNILSNKPIINPVCFIEEPIQPELEFDKDPELF